MTTRLYLSRSGLDYAPPTTRGTWSKTSGFSIVGMDAIKDHPSLGEVVSSSNFEGSSAVGYTTLVMKAVSAPLAADHTFGGTLDVMLAVMESIASADFAYFVHAFVTQGDSDLLRGTLLSNYGENLTNEWPTTAAGRAFIAPQTLTPVSALEGDRIVAEIGFISFNTTLLNRTGTIYHGGGGSDLVASGAPESGVGYLEFSDIFTLFSDPIVRASQLAVETLRRPAAPNACISQLAIETLRRPAAPRAVFSQAVVEVLRRNGAPPPPEGAQNNMIFVIAG